jgi:mutator protein MutT
MNHALAVKAWIVDDKNRLLTIKREPKDTHKPGIWEIPGGRLEPGENPFDGLKREVKEEVGLDIEIVEPLSVWHFTRQDSQVITMIVFVCKPTAFNVKLSDEHTEFSWEDLKKPHNQLNLYQDYDNDLKEYKRRFKN